MPANTTDALSPTGVSASLVPAINFELIRTSKDDQAVKNEIAQALQNMQRILNTYISRKGL